MSNKIIFDLDDTLINTRNRHYHVVKSFYNTKYSDEFIDFETYQKLRLSGNSNFEILSSFYNINNLEFKNYWLSNIEKSAKLNLDENIINIKLLNDIKQKFKLNFIVVSLRSNLINALKQVKNLNFYNEFEKFIFLKHSELNPKVQILNELNKNREISFFIGDSYTDYEAAKLNKIKFIHVQTGWERENLLYKESYSNVNTALKKIFYE